MKSETIFDRLYTAYEGLEIFLLDDQANRHLFYNAEQMSTNALQERTLTDWFLLLHPDWHFNLLVNPDVQLKSSRIVQACVALNTHDFISGKTPPEWSREIDREQFAGMTAQEQFAWLTRAASEDSSSIASSGR